MKLKTPYPDVIVNAFKSVRAWKSLSLILIGILIFETLALAHLAGQRNVLLVPQHLAYQSESIELNLGEPFSPAYLTSVARGDAYSLLNWTPHNIDQQYGLFISRLTPALHDVQKESLLAEALSHRQEGLTQSFYVTRSYVKDSEVSLYGILVRSVSGREVFRGNAAYAIEYSNVGNGMLEISNVRQPDHNRLPTR